MTRLYKPSYPELAVTGLLVLGFGWRMELTILSEKYLEYGFL